MRLCKNLKPKSSMSLLPDPNLRLHLQCYVCLNAAKTTLPSLNIEFYGQIVRGNYNTVPMQFSGIQVPPSMANSSEIDSKKKISLK